MKAKKASRPNSLVNSMRRKPACGELVARQDAILPVCQPRQTPFQRG
jgi:hypothetical protein